MPILNIQTSQVGLVGTVPYPIYINTNDTYATVLTLGYLNQARQEGFVFSNQQMALVLTSDQGVVWLTVEIVGTNVSLTGIDVPGEVVLPTIANHIATYTNTTGTLSEDPATAISGGNIQAGLSGTAGTVASFPSALNSGKLSLSAVTNSSGNFNTTISNAAAVGQSQVISIPDSGVASTSFILSNNGGTQTIATGGLALASGSFVATTGGFQAGSSGHAGTFTSFPGTAANGTLVLAAVNAGGAFNSTISNRIIGQSTVFSIGDPGQATASILTSKVIADVGANLISFDVTVGQAALAAGGSVTLYASSGSKQYKIRNIWINSGGTNFSGGGGDRLGQIGDGTTIYSIIPATNMQTLINAGWGMSTPLPFPAAAAINTSTAAGASLVFKYNAGSADYTAGSIVISGILERVV